MSVNIENLKLMRNRLKRLPNYRFDISLFVKDGSPDPSPTNGCNTVGCILGWATTIQKLAPLPHEEDYCNYSSRITGITDWASPMWDYIFAAEWSHYEPTRKEAIARLDKVINGFVPTERDLPWMND